MSKGLPVPLWVIVKEPDWFPVFVGLNATFIAQFCPCSRVGVQLFSFMEKSPVRDTLERRRLPAAVSKTALVVGGVSVP